MTRLTFDTVLSSYEQKGHSLHKHSAGGFFSPSASRKLRTLQAAMDFLETLPDETMPTATATPTVIDVLTATVDSITEPTQETNTVTEATQKFETTPKPQELFDTIIRLNDRLEVSRTCNEFLDLIATKWSVSTISKKLTEYKKPF